MGQTPASHLIGGALVYADSGLSCWFLWTPSWGALTTNILLFHTDTHAGTLMISINLLHGYFVCETLFAEWVLLVSGSQQAQSYCSCNIPAMCLLASKMFYSFLGPGILLDNKGRERQEPMHLYHPLLVSHNHIHLHVLSFHSGFSMLYHPQSEQAWHTGRVCSTAAWRYLLLSMLTG